MRNSFYNWFVQTVMQRTTQRSDLFPAPGFNLWSGAASRSPQPHNPEHPDPRFDTLIPLDVNSMKKPISLTVNGKRVTHEVEPRLLLIHFLRETLGLTGPHIGCETSLCGACTIDVDGKAIKSCAMFAVQAAGKSITTIEGLASADGKLHPIQEGFWEEHGLQCGYCTPGMIMASKQLLERNPNPTDDEIRHGIDGNLCRCTGYQHIVNAVKNAAQKMTGKTIRA